MPRVATLFVAFSLVFALHIRSVGVIRRSHGVGKMVFVTAIFVSDGRQRWREATAVKSLKVMHKSLQRSQSKPPELHVFTDIESASTLMKHSSNLVIHLANITELPVTLYCDAWKSLSRNKLHFVQLLLKQIDHVVWIDLDTIVFADLQPAFQKARSWVAGYQHGGCGGLSTCSDFPIPISPQFDALGDLWSLDSSTIDEVIELERKLAEKNQLPKYDLQGIFTLILMRKSRSIKLLHELIPYNFGFFCYNFSHSLEDLKLTTQNGRLICDAKQHVSMSKNVGAISFTGETMQTLLRAENISQLQHVGDRLAYSILEELFTGV
jgi:hypothetical protein